MCRCYIAMYRKYIFFIGFSHENEKKKLPSKVVYFIKIQEVFPNSPDVTAQMTQKWKFMLKIWLRRSLLNSLCGSKHCMKLWNYHTFKMTQKCAISWFTLFHFPDLQELLSTYLSMPMRKDQCFLGFGNSKTHLTLIYQVFNRQCELQVWSAIGVSIVHTLQYCIVSNM